MLKVLNTRAVSWYPRLTTIVERMQHVRRFLSLCGFRGPRPRQHAPRWGAEVIGQVGSVGVIREGADADLLVLKTNPLESLKALRQRVALYLNGKEIK